jgi:lysophospholipase L1-like esterase
LEKINITFIGDSFVEGYGDPANKGWVYRVCEYTCNNNSKLSLNICNLGIRGETSGDILNRYEAVIKEEQINAKTNMLVMSFGTNDCIQYYYDLNLDLTRSANNLKELIKKSKKQFDSVLFVLPPAIAENEINKRIKSLIEIYIPILETNKIPFINLYDTLLENEIWQYETATFDGAHPKEKGYTEFAKLIYNHKNWIIQ